MRKFQSRHVSSVAHALAKLDFMGAAWTPLWKDLEGAALARSDEFEPQGLANMVWAFATAGHAAPALFDAIGVEATGKVREF